MPHEEPATKTAKILYRPWGLVGSVLAGLIASKIFQLLWKRVVPVDSDDPPKALESEYTLGQVVLAATLQGAIFAVVKAIIQRGSARGFQRWTGEWPGN